jgi:hypothetical protein
MHVEEHTVSRRGCIWTMACRALHLDGQRAILLISVGLVRLQHQRASISRFVYSPFASLLAFSRPIGELAITSPRASLVGGFGANVDETLSGREHGCRRMIGSGDYSWHGFCRDNLDFFTCLSRLWLRHWISWRQGGSGSGKSKAGGRRREEGDETAITQIVK